MRPECTPPYKAVSFHFALQQQTPPWLIQAAPTGPDQDRRAWRDFAGGIAFDRHLGKTDALHH